MKRKKNQLNYSTLQRNNIPGIIMSGGEYYDFMLKMIVTLIKQVQFLKIVAKLFYITLFLIFILNLFPDLNK